LYYVGWEELEQDAGPEASGAAERGELPADELAQHEARLAELMAERTKLEQRLLKLLGKAPPDADERRENARFPMPIHTAESRMEDRRLAREEERARAAARRALERMRLRAGDERERAEVKRDQERAAIQLVVLQENENRQREARRQDWMRALRVQDAIQERRPSDYCRPITVGVWRGTPLRSRHRLRNHPVECADVSKCEPTNVLNPCIAWQYLKVWSSSRAPQCRGCLASPAHGVPAPGFQA